MLEKYRYQEIEDNSLTVGFACGAVTNEFSEREPVVRKRCDEAVGGKLVNIYNEKGDLIDTVIQTTALTEEMRQRITHAWKHKTENENED